MKSLIKNNFFTLGRKNFNFINNSKNSFIKINLKNFVSSHNHESHDKHHQENHHREHDTHNTDHHEDHGHDHHHEITGEVDLNKVHVNQSSEIHRFVSLVGLSNRDNNNIVNEHIHGHYKALYAQRSISIPLFHQGRRQYRGLTNTLNEDNPYFHSEPYGSIFATFLFKRKNHPDSIAESVFHAHYAANLIEDEIIKIRDNDYPLRLKYAKLKAEAEGRSFEETTEEQ